MSEGSNLCLMVCSVMGVGGFEPLCLMVCSVMGVGGFEPLFDGV